MEKIIELKGVKKTFVTKEKTFDALKGIDLTVNRGDIFGIIGMSGAGKSTLIRCMNLLERPTAGEVLVQNKNLERLSEKALQQIRRQTAMIFQHFNLLMQETIQDNVAFALEITGIKRKEARSRALVLLEKVGLSEKATDYPVTLSGGQKQRVAIARALANNPSILLCDEATSALDPVNTEEILSLLEQINRELGVTVVLITHEMAVVKRICNRVVRLEEGLVTQEGAPEEIFNHQHTVERIKEVS